jgi:hypothetical protein
VQAAVAVRFELSLPTRGSLFRLPARFGFRG